jgi:hypothetical protein
MAGTHGGAGPRPGHLCRAHMPRLHALETPARQVLQRANPPVCAGKPAGHSTASGLVDVAELIVSELVTNVVLAATEPDGRTPKYFDGALPVYQVGLFSDLAELRDAPLADIVRGAKMRELTASIPGVVVT